MRDASTHNPDAVAPSGPRELFCHDLPTRPRPEIGRILVTGASGYVGGRLVPELAARGYQVRVMVRKASAEQTCLWPDAETVVADALDPVSIEAAMEGVHTAYYLIHSLYLGPSSFAATDIQAAVNFREAAQRAGIRRIIYLGGLGDVNARLSAHLRSRMKVAEELRSGSVPVTVLRAAIIIGSGSASYEIIEHLVRSLPIIPIPRWARNRCQPIGIRDVVKYLVGVLEAPGRWNRSLDIGGRDVLTYQNMMKTLAHVLAKRRIYVPWPFSSLSVSSYLASLVTPVPAPLVRCLFDGLANDVVCQGEAIRELVPFEPLGYREMVVRAMTREEQDRVYTRWTDAYPPAHELALRLDELKKPPRYIAPYSLATNKDAASLYAAFCKVGGREGWFHNNWMWRLRGTIDRLLLGVGLSRGRRSRSALKTNDVIDFWRVEDLLPDRRLLLRAEMKLPGRAWLEFAVRPGQGKENVLSVTGHFDVDGWAGIVYWYLSLPFHHLVFTRLLEQIETRS